MRGIAAKSSVSAAATSADDDDDHPHGVIEIAVWSETL